MLLSLEEILNNLSQSTDLPLLTALLLGLTVALNPCQLAITISALTYLANNDKYHRVFFIRSFLYALGRMTTYSTWLVVNAYFIKWVENRRYSKDIVENRRCCSLFLVIISCSFFLSRIPPTSS